MKHLVTLVLALVGCRGSNVEQPLPDLHDVAYGDDAAMRLDLYLPEDVGGEVPLVVWVHGGGWFTGDKSNKIADKVALFTSQGWALASIDYRLSPEPPSKDPARVMYPVHPSDVARAIDWLRDHAADHGLDRSRIALLGHSAGAHLVALVSTDERFLGVHGASLASIACTGSFDTEAYDVAAALASPSDQQRAILENAFGTDPVVHAAASPIRHVAAGKGIPPFIIALRGTDERKTLQRAFVDALVNAGIATETIDASGLSHAEVNERIGASGEMTMTPPLVAFLSDCFQ